jgi:predicted Zn-dependent peptidase
MARNLVLAAACLASSLAHADDPKIPFEKYKLANGLEVLLVPDPTQPLVAVNVWYHVGSGDEVPGKSGFAHLFEHLMFQGTKNTGTDQHHAVLRKVGSNEVNGSTTTDRTNYFETVPANQLETALWLESERMAHLFDALDPNQLANQIEVVRNERRQRYDNVPYAKAQFALHDALYPGDHPYRYLTIGRHEDLEVAKIDDAKKFFRTWYVPANATLALVGDFDSAEAKRLVEKWFGAFPASTKPQVVTVPAPVVGAKEITVEDSFATLRQITFAWHSPAAYADGDAELEVLANALAAEGTGRLYKSLVYDKQLAQTVRANQDGRAFSGQFTITITLRSGADIGETKRLVVGELAHVAKDNLTAQELARVVAHAEVRAIYSLEDLMTRANVLQRYNHFLGDPDRMSWDLDRYRNTTPDKIRAIAVKTLAPDHMITVITQPAGGVK